MSSTIQTWAGLAGRRVLITGNSSDAVPSSGDHRGGGSLVLMPLSR